MKKQAFTMLELILVVWIMLAMVFFVWRYVGKNSDTARSSDGIRHEIDIIVHNALEIKKDNAWGTFEDINSDSFASYFPPEYKAKTVNNEYVEFKSIIWRGCKYQIKHDNAEFITYKVFMDCSSMNIVDNKNDDTKAIMESKAKSFFSRLKPKAIINAKAISIDDIQFNGSSSDGMILIDNLD
jgi:competence protein ComGC